MSGTRSGFAADDRGDLGALLRPLIEHLIQFLALEHGFGAEHRGPLNGTPFSASLVQTPCRSGSPHGVFGTAAGLEATAAFGAGAGDCPRAVTSACAAATSASAVAPAITIPTVCFFIAVLSSAPAAHRPAEVEMGVEVELEAHRNSACTSPAGRTRP